MKFKLKKTMVLLVLIECSGLISCTDFFSTSLAPWAVRNPASLIPQVTPGNVRELIVQAENNPEMSLAILKGIQNVLGNVSPEEKGRLQAAALAAASNTTGFGSSLLTQAGQLTSVLGDQSKAKDMVVDAINGMRHLEEASNLLGAILPDPATDPEGFQGFVNQEESTPEMLVLSAAVILAAESKKNLDSADFINSFDAASVDPSSPLNLSVQLAGAAVTKLETEGTDSPLLDVLGGLNLIPQNKDVPLSGGADGSPV
jgi:hypothetical protein